MRHSSLLWPAAVLGLALVAAPLASQAATLKFAEQNSETSWVSTHGTQPWLKAVSEASNGTITFDLYSNQSLSKGNQTWQATKSGIADVSWNAMAVYPGLNPLAEVITLPGLGFSTPMAASAAIWKVYEKFPSVSQRYADNRMIAIYATVPFMLVTSQPVTNLQALKGKKIRTVAGPNAALLEALGAVPVVMPMPDVYLGIQRGTIDGTLATWESFSSFRFYEVAKNIVTNAPFSSSLLAVAMNKKSYDRLPAEGKAAIDKFSALEGSVWWSEHGSYSCLAVPGILKEKGIKLNIMELGKDEHDRWFALGVKPVQEKWLKDTVDKGYADAPAVFEFLMSQPK